MLQISQTEKPMCSATMDQIKLRLAMNFPLACQNFSSSGFQSAIHVSRMAIGLSFRSVLVAGPDVLRPLLTQAVCQSHGAEKPCVSSPSCAPNARFAGEAASICAAHKLWTK